MVATPTFTPYSTLTRMMGKSPDWWPESERERLGSYDKYDELYWNDPTEYALRVLEDEEAIHVPNARTIVDTTAHYLLKGLKITPKKGPDEEMLTAFLKRERFYSRFKGAKKTGIARGDFAFHITGDPLKKEGSRLTMEPIHPGMVWKEEDPEEPGEFSRMHLFDVIEMEEGNGAQKEIKERVRVLTYERFRAGTEENAGDTAQVWREEKIYEMEPAWYGPDAEVHSTLLEREMLDPLIENFPVYWFNNIEWGDQLYGSSELRGLEFLDWAVSQGTTDLQASVGLDGLGVYATDGGRPVDDAGNERDWEVAPGKVMEVPAGAYFRRVEGIGSITPGMDLVKYLEQKMYQSTAMTDVSLGQIDVAEAQSGIALAIKFLPTLAKLEDRDTAAIEILQQMFFDLKAWFQVYESYTFSADVEVSIDKAKLPTNRVDVLNELNNMIDRKIISRKTYREIANEQLGYSIPADEDDQLIKEAQIFQVLSPEEGTNPAEQNQAGNKPTTSSDRSNNGGNVDKAANQSNNGNRPNESSGTEAGQSPSRQTKS